MAVYAIFASSRQLVAGPDAPISDIDTTGAGSLRQTLDCLDARHITFALTRVEASVRQLLGRYELLERIGDGHIFETNRDALEAFQRDTGLPKRQLLS
jgi:MFS superfamily sulfate permease-like transporter